MPHPLYQAILVRRSTRRYEPAPLAPDSLDGVRQAIDTVRPLLPGNQFYVLHREGMLVDREFVACMGIYGRIITPPHVLAPYLTGTRHPLVDLGFRTEQIVIRLTAMGIGTCYIGALSREQPLRRRLGLPAQARCGALVVFGQATKSAGGRALNDLIRKVPKGERRLPEEEVFFTESFQNPGSPSAGLKDLITAGRLAPSAVNAQPWRFLWSEGQLHLFIKRLNPKYGPGTGQDYRYYDGGICMANISLALEAMGEGGKWVVYDGEVQPPPHPGALQPLAVLRLA